MLLTLLQATAQASNTASKINVEQLLDRLLNWGIEVGKDILAAIIIYIVGRFIIKQISRLVSKILEKRKLEISVQTFLKSLLSILLNLILAFAIISKLGVETTSFAAILASAGVAIGMALSGNLSNFAGGLIILVFKPFKVGDYIDGQGASGTVKEIQIFYTKLSTIDNKTIVIPNGMLTNNSITNATAKDERQLDLRVGISYNADIKKAKSMIEKLLSEDASILKEEQMNVFVNDLADSAVVLGIRAWVKNEEYWATRWRLLEEIKVELDENGIEIPYPQVTVHMKEDK